MSTLTNEPPCDRCPPARAGTGTVTTARIANARISVRAIRYPLDSTHEPDPARNHGARGVQGFHQELHVVGLAARAEFQPPSRAGFAHRRSMSRSEPLPESCGGS